MAVLGSLIRRCRGQPPLLMKKVMLMVMLRLLLMTWLMMKLLMMVMLKMNWGIADEDT